MRILVANIGPEGLPVDETLGKERLAEIFLDDLPTSFSPVGPVACTGLVRVLGLDLVVQIDCTLRLATECAGCLEPFDLDVPVGFQVTLRPAARPLAMDKDKELTAGDLGEAFYSGDELDLDGLLREQIILALPMFPRCSGTCRGLCPDCGLNLNTSDCDCERGEIDPRLAALKAFKTQ